jgi:hypothetical protein
MVLGKVESRISLKKSFSPREVMNKELLTTVIIIAKWQNTN